jgi:hypothetical protein
MTVYWNEKFLNIVTPTDENTKNLTFEVYGNNGSNFLKFCPSKCT